jgi:hypothetical protein
MVVACVVELSGPPVVAAEIALAVVGAALCAAMPALRGAAADPDPGRTRAAAAVRAARLLVPAAMLVAGAVATAHFLVFELVLDWAAPPSGVPFVGVTGLTLLAYLLGLLAVGWMERSWAVRQSLAALGVLITAATCAAELQDVALVAAWAALAVLALAIWRALATVAARAGARDAFRPILPIGSGDERTTRLLAANVLRIAALFVAGCAVTLTLRQGLPPAELGVGELPEVPFTDTGAAMGAILAAAAVLAGLVTGGPFARRAGILLAGLAIVYTIPFEVEPWAVAVLWSALAIAAFVSTRLDAAGTVPYLVAGFVILGLAAATAVLYVAPPSRLVLSADGLTQLEALQSLAALASVLGAGVVAIALFRSVPWVRWAEIAVGILGVYLVSVGVVDVFATQVGGTTSVEELRWQSQAALSVTWALMGMISFVAGLRLGRADVRVGGLVLLGVTTAKVFVVDLAALDVVYKVMALFGLGLVLLVSGGLWQRLHLRPPGTPHGHAGVSP